MRTYHPPSGLKRGLEVLIDADWTLEQDHAVIELLDETRGSMQISCSSPVHDLGSCRT